MDTTIDKLKPGDIFMENDYCISNNLKIVESLRIVEEMKLVYVMFRFLDEDGGPGCTYDIYDSTFNVIKLSI